MNDEQRRILAAANETIVKGIIGTESLIAQMELLRILSLEDIRFPTLVYQMLQQNASLLERLCNQYGIDRIVDLVVPQGLVIPPRAEAIEETKRVLQAELDNWQRVKREYHNNEQKQLIRDSDVEPNYAPEVHQLATRLGWFGEVRTKTHVLELIDRGWVEVVVSPNGLYVRATEAGLTLLNE